MAGARRLGGGRLVPDLWVPKTCATWPDAPLTASCPAACPAHARFPAPTAHSNHFTITLLPVGIASIILSMIRRHSPARRRAKEKTGGGVRKKCHFWVCGAKPQERRCA